MCMGCAGTVLINSDGKTPDTTEAAMYLVGLALWFFVLTHFYKKQTVTDKDPHASH